MKLLMVTCLKEYQKAVAGIFEKSDVRIFSVTETIGFKDHHRVNLLDNWFSSGNEQFDSVFLFSFTENEKAEKALTLVQEYNAGHDTGFPIRAFILPVDKASYSNQDL